MHSCSGASIPGSVQGWIGQGLVWWKVALPMAGIGIGWFKGPFQPKPFPSHITGCARGHPGLIEVLSQESDVELPGSQRWHLQGFQVVRGDVSPRPCLLQHHRLKQSREFCLSVSAEETRMSPHTASFQPLTSEGQRDKLGSRSRCSYTHE